MRTNWWFPVGKGEEPKRDGERGTNCSGVRQAQGYVVS